jgi:hypothetical protein
VQKNSGVAAAGCRHKTFTIAHPLTSKHKYQKWLLRKVQRLSAGSSEKGRGKKQVTECACA